MEVITYPFNCFSKSKAYLTKTSLCKNSWASPVAHPPTVQEMWETWVWSLRQEDSLEEDMATHSSILAWRIPWTEKPGRLQSIGLKSQTQLSGWACTHRKGCQALEARRRGGLQRGRLKEFGELMELPVSWLWWWSITVCIYQKLLNWELCWWSSG